MPICFIVNIWGALALPRNKRKYGRRLIINSSYCQNTGNGAKVPRWNVLYFSGFNMQGRCGYVNVSSVIKHRGPGALCNRWLRFGGFDRYVIGVFSPENCGSEHGSCKWGYKDGNFRSGKVSLSECERSNEDRHRKAYPDRTVTINCLQTVDDVVSDLYADLATLRKYSRCCPQQGPKNADINAISSTTVWHHHAALVARKSVRHVVTRVNRAKSLSAGDSILSCTVSSIASARWEGPWCSKFWLKPASDRKIICAWTPSVRRFAGGRVGMTSARITPLKVAWIPPSCKQNHNSMPSNT